MDDLKKSETRRQCWGSSHKANWKIAWPGHIRMRPAISSSQFSWIFMNFLMCCVNSIPHVSSGARSSFSILFRQVRRVWVLSLGTSHSVKTARPLEEASHALLAGCIDALMRHAVSLGAGATEKDLWRWRCSGVGKCWVYWTSPYSSHYRPYT